MSQLGGDRHSEPVLESPLVVSWTTTGQQIMFLNVFRCSVGHEISDGMRKRFYAKIEVGQGIYVGRNYIFQSKKSVGTKTIIIF